MPFHLNEAARRVGVSPATLKRWFREKRIPEVDRDRNGWRIFEERDIERIRSYAERRTHAAPGGPATNVGSAAAAPPVEGSGGVPSGSHPAPKGPEKGG